MGATLAFGAALRVRQWLSVRSFWLDEIYLLQEIVARSPRDLVGTFESSQSAPIGFLWWAKACESLLGDGELSMRVPSLVAGLLLLVVAARLAALLLHPVAAVAAVALVAANERLVYFSAELKQYGLDALWSTLLVMLLVDVVRADDRRQPLRLWTVAAVAAPWMSHASILVVAATGLVLAHLALRERRPEPADVVVAGIASLASLGTVYVLQLRGIASDPLLQGYWEDGFAPRPWNADVISWTWDTWSAFASGLAGVSPAAVALAFVAGGLTLRRVVVNRVTATALLLALIVLVASTVEAYPARDRLLLFVVPLVLVLCVAGVERVATASSVPRVVRFGAVVVGIAVGAPAVADGARVLVDPLRRSETRDVVAAMADLAEPGDVVVTSADGYIPLLHYGAEVGLEPDLVVLRRDVGRCIGTALLPSSGRVWLVFGYHSTKDPDPIGTFGPWFDAWADRRRALTAPLASAYLYDVQQPASSVEPSTSAGCVEVVEAP